MWVWTQWLCAGVFCTFLLAKDTSKPQHWETKRHFPLSLMSASATASLCVHCSFSSLSSLSVCCFVAQACEQHTDLAVVPLVFLQSCVHTASAVQKGVVQGSQWWPHGWPICLSGLDTDSERLQSKSFWSIHKPLIININTRIYSKQLWFFFAFNQPLVINVTPTFFKKASALKTLHFTTLIFLICCLINMEPKIFCIFCEKFNDPHNLKKAAAEFGINHELSEPCNFDIHNHNVWPNSKPEISKFTLFLLPDSYALLTEVELIILLDIYLNIYFPVPPTWYLPEYLLSSSSYLIFTWIFTFQFILPDIYLNIYFPVHPTWYLPEYLLSSTSYLIFTWIFTFQFLLLDIYLNIYFPVPPTWYLPEYLLSSSSYLIFTWIFTFQFLLLDIYLNIYFPVPCSSCSLSPPGSWDCPLCSQQRRTGKNSQVINTDHISYYRIVLVHDLTYSP